MMGKVLSISEKRPVNVSLPDGIYFGLWGGSIIDLEYKGKNYELATEEGVRGIGIKVLVSIKDGVPSFEEINN